MHVRERERHSHFAGVHGPRIKGQGKASDGYDVNLGFIALVLRHCFCKTKKVEWYFVPDPQITQEEM